jgi:hypothetical protein
LLEDVIAERRAAAPADERGQVGEKQRHDHARGCPRVLAEQAELDHLGADVTFQLRKGEALDRNGDVERVVVGAGLGEEEDRPRRMLLGEAGERLARRLAPLRRHPGHVRHHARAQIRLVAQRGELALDLPDADVGSGPLAVRERRRQRLRQDRPSRASSSSAASGPHVPAA